MLKRVLCDCVIALKALSLIFFIQWRLSRFLASSKMSGVCIPLFMSIVSVESYSSGRFAIRCAT